MTPEQQAILIAAKGYVIHGDEVNLGNLVTAVMNLPMSQWPANACQIRQTTVKDAMRMLSRNLPTAGEILECTARTTGNASDDLEGVKC